MSLPNIIVVAGSSGVGKTTWVCQQMRDIADVDKIIYYSPGTGTVPVVERLPGAMRFCEIRFYISITKAYSQ